MRTAAESIEIERPPEQLFDFMLDGEHAGEWRDMVTRMEWIDSERRVGARVRLVYFVEGRERIQELTLIEFDRPCRYAFASHSDGYRGIIANSIVPRGSGSLVTSTVDVTGDNIWCTLLMPLLRKRHRARLPLTLQRLKFAAERR